MFNKKSRSVVGFWIDRKEKTYKQGQIDDANGKIN
jgi:hypothetical protein